jgi:hypothetical protein
VKTVVSYGGGVDSTAMTLLLERGEKPDLVVFCDTGGEYPETYAYLDRFDAYLRERAQVGVTRTQAKEARCTSTCSPGGGPRAACTPRTSSDGRYAQSSGTARSGAGASPSRCALLNALRHQRFLHQMAAHSA